MPHVLVHCEKMVFYALLLCVLMFLLMLFCLRLDLLTFCSGVVLPWINGWGDQFRRYIGKLAKTTALDITYC